ncbi:hypothetical protein B9Z55_002950 [Caenorhabditis nigoni]|uniref:Uncharacterized protein n=1 Tax=Caenorhabditis nigoni TaxID=1611254 RepID=A0A2G5VMW4_9PELO|nr:hypothetical protein B9Z55_002950 [Caenorhabditis nigoni]
MPKTPNWFDNYYLLLAVYEICATASTIPYCLGLYEGSKLGRWIAIGVIYTEFCEIISSRYSTCQMLCQLFGCLTSLLFVVPIVQMVPPSLVKKFGIVFKIIVSLISAGVMIILNRETKW